MRMAISARAHQIRLKFLYEQQMPHACQYSIYEDARFDGSSCLHSSFTITANDPALELYP